jgi:hypothetical protein
MKKRIGIISTFILASLLVMACNKSKDDIIEDNSSNITAVQVANIAQSGDWRITYFYDTDQDETSNFSGYSFSFNQGGALVAVNGNTTVAGTWSITDNSGSSSDDDGSSSDNDNDFNIFFASPADFDDLSDDWDIVSISEVKIELIDVSGGNGGTDYLTFEKL